MNILVTAGPTREPIDAVRFIGNRSSGKMGYAVATEALQSGNNVRLITGPVAIPAPVGAEVIHVETAAQMLAEVRSHLPWCDVLVMVAAVADWRPVNPPARKLKKEDGPPRIELERTEDILATIKPEKGGRIVVGFAAETHDVLNEAARKCERKGLDMIVANDVSSSDAGFEVDTNRVTFLFPDGSREPRPLMPKSAVAREIMARISALTRVAKR